MERMCSKALAHFETASAAMQSHELERTEGWTGRFESLEKRCIRRFATRMGVKFDNLIHEGRRRGLYCVGG